MTDGWPGVLIFLSDVLFTAVSSLSLLLLINSHQLVCTSSCWSDFLSPSFSLLQCICTPLALTRCLPNYLYVYIHSFFAISLLLFLCQEKRRLQEEQDRAKREMEDEKLRLQQLKVWHTYPGWSNPSRSFTHIFTRSRSLNFTLLESSEDTSWLVSKQTSSKSISFSHTHAHADELYNLPHFLVLPVPHKVTDKPSSAEISFYVNVYTHCKSQSCSIVFTSFPHCRSHFLLHCVTLPRGTFLKLCEICAACVSVHAGMHSVH